MWGEDFEEGQFSDADEDEGFQTQNTFKGKPLFNVEKKVADLRITDNKTNNEDNDDDDDDDYFCNNDYDLDEEKNTVVKTSSQRPNAQTTSTKVTNYQPKHKLLTRYSNKINLEKYAGPSLPGHVANVLVENDRRVDKDRIRTKDKSDHATIENVLDSRIKNKLHKLFERGVLAEINGCISTGKEANVYYARSKNEDEIAIKIYRTSILTFRNREKYIRGEYRFDHVHSLHNPRKMVKIWAEKEFSNLKRLEQGGVRAPRPLLCGGHMLLMEFLGSDGWAAPKLKDAVLTDSKSRTLYRECIEIMWKMYKCRLVHADLSEYNMLYHDGSIVVIDVSQAVDRDHCNAMEFLRNDCSNVTAFFKKHNVGVMPLQALFDFITDPTINETNMDEYLDMWMQEADQEKDPQQQEIEEAVFKQAYIPQRLTQVINVERDINLAKSGKDLIYKTLIGLKADLSKPAETPEILANKHKADSKSMKEGSDADTSSEDNDESDSENESETDSDNKSKFVNSARPRDESPESRKARKKAVKEQQAEKRKVKIKKHVKKRKIKVSSKGGK